MKLFGAEMEAFGHEQIIFCQNREAGLKAIIAIHDTTLGPALGGTRMWPYESEDEAVLDALRLARGMTYKATAAGLNMGGGKGVIIADSKKDKSEPLFRAYGRFVESLQGRFITGEDVGVDVNDVEYVFMETRYVAGLSQIHGGGGDPAPVTAYGVLNGLKACALEVFGSDVLKGRSVALQGLGSVGFHLALLLREQQVRVVACDIDPEKAARAQERMGIEVVDPDEIYEVEADIFSPCALGAVVNDRTLPRLRFKIIAGAANNQLEEDRHGEELDRRRILYAPDYVINAGGMINVFVELEGYDRTRAMRMSRGIYYNLRKVFEIAREEGTPTSQAADRMVEQRIDTLRRLKSLWTPCRPARMPWERR